MCSDRDQVTSESGTAGEADVLDDLRRGEEKGQRYGEREERHEGGEEEENNAEGSFPAA